MWSGYLPDSVLLPALGMLLDLLAGDPRWLTSVHPVCLIGRWIGLLDRRLNPVGKADSSSQLRAGVLMVLLVLMPVAVTVYAVTACFPLTTAIWTFFGLAARSLRDESTAVYRRLRANDTEGARKAVSMIVGRDTESLTRTGIIRAAVETVAEGTCDGVIAPLFWLGIGGPAGLWIYKAINTMDSMVGYKNDRYFYFGRAAARLDDAANYLPSRIAALLLIQAAYLTGRSGRGAWKIWRRDRRKHASPNSAQTESVCAGALGLQLAGDASYFGRILHKEIIGDPLREPEPEDIVRANHLMMTAAAAGGIIALGMRWMMAIIRLP